MWKILFFLSGMIYWTKIYNKTCMQSLFSKILLMVIIAFSTVSLFSLDTYAAGDGASGVYGDVKSQDDLRTGNFTMDDIPNIIASVIEILLGIAGTISIVALIYHAVRMQLSSGITGDSSGVDKAKAGIKWALLGFALSLSAWFLITKFVELLSSNT